VLSVLGLVLCASAVTTARAQLIISEFRLRGPNGANDEFIEIYNNSGGPHTVAAISGTGYGLAASNGVTRCTIPNGTVIPNGGHYLCVNSVGYSLSSYPAGSGNNATGDATYTTDIADNAGIALFNNSTGGASYSLANRMDAVGSTSEANTLYKEGTGYPALTPFSIDYAFYRDDCGKSGSITTFGPCTISGPKDTNNNAADFIFVDTNGTSAGAGQRLGAPGPQNRTSPIQKGGALAISLFDPCAPASSPPNQVRDFTSDPAQNSTFGTFDIRRTITNDTGAAINRLRYRIVDLTTFPAPSGIADLRPRTSTDVVVTVDRAPCGSGTSNVTVRGTTFEQPPSQPNGGGFNSSMSSGTVTLATPLASGASIDVRFLLGIQQNGSFKFGVTLEALPGGSGSFMVSELGDANLSIVKNDSADPVSAGSNIPYTLTATNASGSVSDAFNVSVSDTIPANTTFVSMTAPAGWTVTTPPAGGTGSVTATRPTLAKGASAAFQLVVKANAATPNGTVITNTASVSSENPDPAPGNNSDTETTTVNAPPGSCTVTCRENITVETTPGSCGAVVNYPPPITAGSCGTVTASPASGSFFPKGTTTVHVNTSSGPACSFTVTVVDTEAPVITCPADQVIETESGQAFVDYPIPTVSDNCPGATLEAAPPPGGAFSEGSTLVTATAGDAAGNMSTCSFNVILVRNSAPGAVSTLANISTRLRVETGENLLIGGFIITGQDLKRVIVRGIGPSLPIPGALADPQLELYNEAAELIGANDNWRDALNQQEIIDTGIPPTNDFESVVLANLAPGGYTALMRGADGGTGVGLLEAFDLDRSVDSRLANISTRGFVQTGEDVMIGGFIVLGSAQQKVIIRALGPSLPVPSALPNPFLELRDENGAIVRENDNWRSDQRFEIQATGVPPSNDLEAAVVSTLPPGAYTAVVRDVGGNIGVGLVEVYALR
jgi:uncharacterized repeat protein (TIGR01451 family)